ncbi:MAG: hypothetical protein ACRDUY_11055 [Nitriliruptorales bacterium]
MSDEVTRNGNGEAGDHRGEMTRRNRLDDRATDALFSGRVPSGREDLADVADLVEALRAAASVSPRPNADLAAVLTEGLSTEKGDLPATAGSNVNRPAPQAAGLPKWRKARRMIEIAVAKLGALGLAAKVGVASAAVVAGTVGGGAAGVLPGPVQDAVAATVEAVTPLDLPDSADAEADVADAGDPDANDHGQEVSDFATTTDLEGCERGIAIAELAGGDPDEPAEECVQGDDEGDGDDAEGRPDEPGVEGRGTADENADENAEEGLDTADDAATNGRDFGEGRVGDDAEAGTDAESDGQSTADENSGGASNEGQETGDDASNEGQETGDDASGSGQETGDDASGSGQETGEDASDSFRP